MGSVFLERLNEMKSSGQILEEAYAQIKEAYLEEKNVAVKKFQPASYDRTNQVKEVIPSISKELLAFLYLEYH